MKVCTFALRDREWRVTDHSKDVLTWHIRVPTPCFKWFPSNPKDIFIKLSGGIFHWFYYVKEAILITWLQEWINKELCNKHFNLKPFLFLDIVECKWPQWFNLTIMMLKWYIHRYRHVLVFNNFKFIIQTTLDIQICVRYIYLVRNKMQQSVH
jgi:hypothetical protein